MNLRTLMTSIALTSVMACAAEVGIPEDEEAAVDVESQPLVTWRKDQTAELLMDGPFGSWEQAIYCNPGTWAKGFAQRVEAHVGGSFDDTALNSVRLRCANSAGSLTETIVSHSGNYGSWGPNANCASNGFVTGGRLRVENSQGSGDDTAANDTEMTCSSGGNLVPGQGLTYGNWSPWTSCAPGSAVCGLATKWEPNQGSGDDTGMNGLKLFCCKK